MHRCRHSREGDSLHVVVLLTTLPLLSNILSSYALHRISYPMSMVSTLNHFKSASTFHLGVYANHLQESTRNTPGLKLGHRANGRTIHLYKVLFVCLTACNPLLLQSVEPRLLLQYYDIGNFRYSPKNYLQRLIGEPRVAHSGRNEETTERTAPS